MSNRLHDDPEARTSGSRSPSASQCGVSVAPTFSTDDSAIPAAGPLTGRPGTFSVEQSTSVIHHTESGDRILIGRRDVQPDAPITTVLAREAVAVLGDLLLLSLGCRVAAMGLDEAQRTWALGMADRAKGLAVEMVGGIAGGSENGNGKPS